MANKSFVIQYLIKARDAFSKQADSATRSFKRFRKEVTENEKAVKSFSSKAANGFKNLAGVLGTFSGLRYFKDVGSTFQTALADLSAITGATGQDLAYLRDESLRLGKEMVVSQDRVATAFKVIASAKSELLEDPKGLSQVTGQVLTLANAARIDLTSAANVTTQALNQFGAGADQAQRFVNVLAAGSKIGASEVAETGVAIIKSGAVAKAVGVNFEELNAAIQVLAKGGVKAEIAGTGLKTALLKMEQLPKRMRPSVVGLGTALENLGAANLDVSQMSKVFGTEAVTIGQILSDNAGLVKEWTRSLTGTRIAQEQAAVNTATFQKKLEKLKIVVDGALIRAFLRLEPVLSDQADKLATWMDGIRPEEIKAAADSLAVMVKGFGAVATGIGWVIQQLQKMGTVWGETVGAITTFNFSEFSEDTTSMFRKAISAASIPGLLAEGGMQAVEFISGGGEPIQAPNAGRPQEVSVGVKVGLEQGLEQKGPVTLGGNGPRRADVGAN